MYICDQTNKICNTVREPVCNRGGDVTAYSVTGTGPGQWCPKPKTPTVTPVTPTSLVCKLTVVTGGSISHLRNQIKNLKTC